MDECSTCNKPNAKVSLPLSLCITKAITISFGSVRCDNPPLFLRH